MDDKGDYKMNTARVKEQKISFDIMAIRVGMGIMEFCGMLMLLCGIFEVQLF